MENDDVNATGLIPECETPKISKGFQSIAEDDATEEDGAPWE